MVDDNELKRLAALRRRRRRGAKARAMEAAMQAFDEKNFHGHPRIGAASSHRQGINFGVG